MLFILLYRKEDWKALVVVWIVAQKAGYGFNRKKKNTENKSQKEWEGKIPLSWSLHTKLQQRPATVGFVFMWIQTDQKLDQNIRSLQAISTRHGMCVQCVCLCVRAWVCVHVYRALPTPISNLYVIYVCLELQEPNRSQELQCETWWDVEGVNKQKQLTTWLNYGFVLRWYLYLSIHVQTPILSYWTYIYLNLPPFCFCVVGVFKIYLDVGQDLCEWNAHEPFVSTWALEKEIYWGWFGIGFQASLLMASPLICAWQISHSNQTAMTTVFAVESVSSWGAHRGLPLPVVSNRVKTQSEIFMAHLEA